MNKLIALLRNQRGFLLLNVIFLTVITSFAAMILLNAAPRVRNSHSTLRLTAIHLANEQFAHLESRAASGMSIGGSYGFLGDKTDLTSENFSAGAPTVFTVEAHVSGSNPHKATVTVSWQVGEKIFSLEAERTILVVTKQTT